jgi:hypothetical protein
MEEKVELLFCPTTLPISSLSKGSGSTSCCLLSLSVCPPYHRHSFYLFLPFECLSQLFPIWEMECMPFFLIHRVHQPRYLLRAHPIPPRLFHKFTRISPIIYSVVVKTLAR